MKDRLGLSLIEDREKSKELIRGGTTIEPTAANTSIGVALAAFGWTCPNFSRN